MRSDRAYVHVVVGHTAVRVIVGEEGIGVETGREERIDHLSGSVNVVDDIPELRPGTNGDPVVSLVGGAFIVGALVAGEAVVIGDRSVFVYDEVGCGVLIPPLMRVIPGDYEFLLTGGVFPY